MPLISKCPKCDKPVTIPEGLDPWAEVRCPLCEGVYPLEEALPELPPALIPVGIPGLPPQESGPDVTEAADGESARGESEESDDESPAEDGVELVDGTSVSEMPPSEILPSGMSPSGMSFSGLAIETGEAEGDATVAGRAVRSRRASNEKGAVRFLVEVFVGGLVGLLVAYYAISWLLPRSSLPKFPLPLLPHTMHWLDDAAPRQESPLGDNTPDPTLRQNP